MDEEQIRLAIAHARDRQIAETVTLVVGLAAETHGSELRKALATVFDLSAVEEMTARIMLVVAATQDKATESRELVRQLLVMLDKIDTRMDELNDRLDRLEARQRPILKGLVANGKAC